MDNGETTEVYETPPRRGRGLLWFLLVLFVLLLLALTAYITYAVQQNKIDKLNTQVSSLTAQLQAKNAQTQPAQSQGQSTQPLPATTTTTPGTVYTSPKGVKITLFMPSQNAKVSSPVAVLGEVPGNWSSEASFPIKLVDSNGNTIAQTTGKLLGDWMTTSLVPFSAQLTYSGAPTGSGSLVLQKDNPSGQAANADQLSIPVQF